MAEPRIEKYAPHIGVVPDEIYHNETIDGSYGNSYTLGVRPTELGDQYAVEKYAIDYGMGESPHFSAIEQLHLAVTNIAQAEQNSFAREIGFGYVEGGAEDSFDDLVVVPSAEFVNAALARIYGSDRLLTIAEIATNEGQEEIDPL